jgi:hypothetical protein
MNAQLTLAEPDKRIAASRDNIRELVELAAANSGAGDEDTAAAIEFRDAALRK